MAIEGLTDALIEVGLPANRRNMTSTPEAVIDHSGRVVIPLWIMAQGLKDDAFIIDSEVEVPARNAEVIDGFLDDVSEHGVAKIIELMRNGQYPYAYIINTNDWDKSGMYFLVPEQNCVRLRTKSKKKPKGYLITLIRKGLRTSVPQANEIDGANFVGTNYLLRKTPFKLSKQYIWTANPGTSTRRFTADYINSLLK